MRIAVYCLHSYRAKESEESYTGTNKHTNRQQDYSCALFNGQALLSPFKSIGITHLGRIGLFTSRGVLSISKNSLHFALTIETNRRRKKHTQDEKKMKKKKRKGD